MTTLTPPCQKCYNSRRGGGDCMNCYRFFYQKDSVKVKIGENGTLNGILCKECEIKA